MQPITDQHIAEAFAGLLSTLQPQERTELIRFQQDVPEVARDALIESARVLMQAKCIALTLEERVFYQGCAPLVALSFTHPGVHDLFAAAADADLANPEGDPLADPAMASLVRERVNRVMSSLG